MTNADQLLNDLIEINALRYGEFVLASGDISTYYIDLRVIPNYPTIFDRVCQMAADYLKDKCPTIDGVAGIPLAGIPFGTLIANKLKVPYYILRKEPKGHGRGKMIEGVIRENANIVLIDDLITTGGSKLFAIEAFREMNAIVENIFVFVNRSDEPLDLFESENNIKVHSFITGEEIINSGLV